MQLLKFKVTCKVRNCLQLMDLKHHGVAECIFVDETKFVVVELKL